MTKLKELREEKDISQIKLSSASNIYPGRLSHLEAGYFQPTEKEIKKLIQGWARLNFDLEREILEIAKEIEN